MELMRDPSWVCVPWILVYNGLDLIDAEDEKFKDTLLIARSTPLILKRTSAALVSKLRK